MAQHHCQMSLEDFINVSGPEPLAAVQRSRMKDNFYSIVNHFRAAETSDNVRGFWPAHYSTIPQHIARYSKEFMEGIMNFFQHQIGYQFFEVSASSATTIAV
ncbi:predicted protein [Histoplasma mississippiense (nom. inval.)]|uniref:predicted protein n=1 Tax=Ajellomyces capsulatus (strain NAm1 / WU24) TaxID=2059318 RepID=UPI000157CFB8|nr:predicted protein [Histoplasma mississippiense (nom. inval.)]EDN11403.1 predicted protein [Histoplasma mississippiense (nom. inval.)]